MTPLTCTMEPEGQDITLRFRGEIDVDTQHTFASWLAQVGPGYQEVLVDMNEVTFMDSSGIYALVVAGQRLGASGCRLIIVNARPNVRHALEIAGIPEMLSIR
jgi:anti-sigma B factor antagonist